MKRLLLICAILVVCLSSCFRKNGKTHHHIETDSYTLTVSGERIFRDRQLAAIPKDTLMTFGDTVTMHDNVTWVALQLDILSQGFGRDTNTAHFRGDYILNLELIHHPGSDHHANDSAALVNLRDWGYIDIDTTDWQDITVVRHGARPEDYSRPTHFYGSESYSIGVPDELLADSVNDITLEQWMNGWMDDFLSTDEELLQSLSTHGYDTVHVGPPRRSTYPHATRSYGNSELIYLGGNTAARLKRAARRVVRQ